MNPSTSEFKQAFLAMEIANTLSWSSSLKQGFSYLRASSSLDCCSTSLREVAVCIMLSIHERIFSFEVEGIVEKWLNGILTKIIINMYSRRENTPPKVSSFVLM